MISPTTRRMSPASILSANQRRTTTARHHPKRLRSLGNIRGLSPEEPTKQGSYYAASIAYYGHVNDLNPVARRSDDGYFCGCPRLTSTAHRDPSEWANRDSGALRQISRRSNSIDATEGEFQPTNQIVDFYPESITPTSGSFRINFEDVEQGADHDMDAIATYHYTVNDDNTVTVNIASDYAAGSIIQHMGYVISGTDADGTYLEVRDSDTSDGSDVDYFLDTPHTIDALPLTASRTFTPSGTSGATLMKDPSGTRPNGAVLSMRKMPTAPRTACQVAPSGTRMATTEPDNYFLVTNALTLKDQLSKAFDEVLDRTGSASTVALTSGSITGNTKAYQARFRSRLDRPDTRFSDSL